MPIKNCILNVNLFLLTLLVFPLATWSQTDKTDKTDQVNELVSRFGIHFLIDEIPQILIHSLNNRFEEKHELEPQQQDQLRNVLTKLFDAKLLKQKINQLIVNTSYDSTLFESLEIVLSSDAATGLIEARKKSFSLEATEDIRKLATAFERKDSDKQRFALLNQLDEASADTEFLVAVQSLSIATIIRVMGSFSKEKSVESSQNLQGLLGLSYSQFLRPSRFTTLMTYMHMYQDQNDATIKKHIQIYKLRNVQWFLGALMQALRDVMILSIEEAMVQVENVKTKS